MKLGNSVYKMFGMGLILVWGVYSHSQAALDPALTPETDPIVARWSVGEDATEEKVTRLEWKELTESFYKVDPKCIDDTEGYRCKMVYIKGPGLIIEVSTFSASDFTGENDGKSTHFVQLTSPKAKDLGIDPDAVKRNSAEANLELAKSLFYFDYELEAVKVPVYKSDCRSSDFDMTQPRCLGPQKTGRTETKNLWHLVLKMKPQVHL